MTTTEPRRVPAPPMPRHDRVSTGATAGIIGAAITLASALVVQLVVQPDTTVSDEQFSYPWPSTALIPVSILYVAAHVLVASGLVALRRSAAAGPSRGGGTGLRLALAGTGFLAAGEVGSIIVRNRLVDDTKRDHRRARVRARNPAVRHRPPARRTRRPRRRGVDGLATLDRPRYRRLDRDAHRARHDNPAPAGRGWLRRRSARHRHRLAHPAVVSRRRTHARAGHVMVTTRWLTTGTAARIVANLAGVTCSGDDPSPTNLQMGRVLLAGDAAHSPPPSGPWG